MTDDKDIKSITTAEPYNEKFEVGKEIFAIRFTLDSTGVPGYIVFKDTESGIKTIEIQAEWVTSVEH